MTQLLKFKDETYTIKALNFKTDLTLFIPFLKANQDHFLDYQTHNPTADDALEFFEDCPPDARREDKYLLGVFYQDNLIGMIDLLDYFPNAENSMIGYLVLLPSYRGLGLAQAIYEWIEKRALKYGFKTLRLCVIKENVPAVKFWVKQSYRELSSYPTEYGEQMTMEKVL